MRHGLRARMIAEPACLYGDPVAAVARVKDLKATDLIAQAEDWAAPQSSR